MLYEDAERIGPVKFEAPICSLNSIQQELYRPAITQNMVDGPDEILVHKVISRQALSILYWENSILAQICVEVIT